MMRSCSYSVLRNYHSAMSPLSLSSTLRGGLISQEVQHTLS